MNLCNLGLHKWEDFDDGTFDPIRGCLKCGKVEGLAFSLGFYNWHRLDGSYDEWKELLLRKKKMHDEQRIEEYYFRLLETGDPDYVAEAIKYFSEKFKNETSP